MGADRRTRDYKRITIKLVDVGDTTVALPRATKIPPFGSESRSK